ncbi:ParB/RepB/Spo0J family partition protein [Sphingopyxis sp. SCN 67-31]|uniref:ParB/RepB/Spo0J family partition protein n=1 Tax=Sphingopyxis sp. SCN 67-31 TaxID=1660142 RepID=UPI0008697753|nr:ParB/RepB/Spo0J family partition protein [Sphingopyxis sp. SCN 67-31]ODU35114.1 MAG: chromosome partitioning protein ParB [Sphingopyxis sp. SCN 67-31]
MTKQAKISLSGAKEIPFSALVLSQANVRRVKAGVSIDSLAADIARRGLLQSLTVRAQRDEEGQETGRYEVPAGGRRFRALQQLVKQRRMSKTEPVPCIVREDDAVSAEEDSLAENVHREPLHPLDQFRSMQKLVEQGTDVETIAATFMVTPAVVKQRLKLAAVSPKLHDIYAEDGMTLEQLMAFSVSSDHARQEQVWEMLSTSHSQQPWYIRARLTEDKVRASDKRVLFVTLDAYLAAGGHVLRDLFESDDGGWLEDVSLLDRLQAEKLDSEVAVIVAEGWKWVETAVDFPYGHTFGFRPLDGIAPENSAEDEARIEALREEADRLEDEWAGCEEIPDEISARIDAIDEEIAPLVSRPLVYEPEEVAIAGTFVSIDVDGSLHIERGFVRPEDEPQQAADEDGESGDGIDGDATGDGAQETAPPEPDTGGGDSREEEDPDDLVRPLPDKLVTDLTAHRTLALRDALASSPLVAFAAMLHALVLECFYTCASSASCVGISLRNHSMIGYDAALNDTPSARAIRERHEGWSARLPDATVDLWDTLAGLDADDQAALFAHCVSFGVNAVWEPATRYNEGRVSARAVACRIEHSHILARASGLDMVKAGWIATTANYLGRVTKPGILDAVEEACGAEAAGRIAGLKKPEMASAAEDLLKATGWLAHPLRTPVLDAAAGDDESAAANDDECVGEQGDQELAGDDIDAIAAE